MKILGASLIIGFTILVVLFMIKIIKDGPNGVD